MRKNRKLQTIPILANFCAHISHLWGFSPVWTSMCCFKPTTNYHVIVIKLMDKRISNENITKDRIYILDIENAAEHSLHLYGFSPV